MSRAHQASVPGHELCLVGHRGWPQAFPENSLAGFDAVLAAGALAIECDVQFSRDGEPMVIHDADLRRTAGRSERVVDLTATELQDVSVHEPERLGQDAAFAPVPRLEQLVALVSQYPAVQLFVEIKEESFAHFSRDYCANRVLQAIAPADRQISIISFDAEVLLPARAGGVVIGWVIRRYNTKTQLQAAALAPDVLICDARKLPGASATLWAGPWQWFVYDIVDPAEAKALYQRGITYIETWDVGGLLRQLSAE